MLVAELTNEGSEHAVKCPLACIDEVEVKVDERLTRKGPLEIFNDSGAENRLATSGNAVEP